MNTQENIARGRQGSTIVAAVVLLAIAGTVIGSVFWAAGGQMRFVRYMINHEKSILLADAGLHCALADLNAGGNGVITNLETARSFFAGSTNRFFGSWGFTTSVSNGPLGRRVVTATGFHQGVGAVVSASMQESTTNGSVHALYSTAVFVGNSSGITTSRFDLAGSDPDADFVSGDVHANGRITAADDAILRNPEAWVDLNGDNMWNVGEKWTESGSPTYWSNALAGAAYTNYRTTMSGRVVYGDGIFNVGEAFIDTIGNGVFDSGEPWDDADGDGNFGGTDTFTDSDGDGTFDAAETFTDRGNGSYDLGEAFTDLNGNLVWDAATAGYWKTVRRKKTWVAGTAAEPYVDMGNGVYNSGEPFEDRNRVYDLGEIYLDDRNNLYDYGTSATGTIVGTPSVGLGQAPPYTNSPYLVPPNLTNMYYAVAKTSATPANASANWGYDINVAAGSFNASGNITATNDPRHIFRRNVAMTSSFKYPKVTNTSGVVLNDYFLEDPTDSTAGDSAQKITVHPNGNNKVYFVDGNLYIHNPNALNFKFRYPGTVITIVAAGNITISDEFYYNGMETAPEDMLVLIALKRTDVLANRSGDVRLGDANYGTGGEVHAMLYAEDDFVDNNLNSSSQPTLSVFGNMTAGDQVSIIRTGSDRTRLDVTLDQRVRMGLIEPPGLPPAVSGTRVGVPRPVGWTIVAGSWWMSSRLAD